MNLKAEEVTVVYRIVLLDIVSHHSRLCSTRMGQAIMRPPRFFMCWRGLSTLLGVLLGHTNALGKDTSVPVWQLAVSTLTTTDPYAMTLQVLQVHPFTKFVTIIVRATTVTYLKMVVHDTHSTICSAGRTKSQKMDSASDCSRSLSHLTGFPNRLTS